VQHRDRQHSKLMQSSKAEVRETSHQAASTHRASAGAEQRGIDVEEQSLVQRNSTCVGAGGGGEWGTWGRIGPSFNSFKLYC
jgi:hypothetical protein